MVMVGYMAVHARRAAARLTPTAPTRAGRARQRSPPTAGHARRHEGATADGRGQGKRGRRHARRHAGGRARDGRHGGRAPRGEQRRAGGRTDTRAASLRKNRILRNRRERYFVSFRKIPTVFAQRSTGNSASRGGPTNASGTDSFVGVLRQIDVRSECLCGRLGARASQRAGSGVSGAAAGYARHV